MTERIEFVLPYPPTVNTYWRRHGNTYFISEAGKRYRREDEIGTPLCVTVDFDTLENDTVTVRDRDTMQQIRLHVDELKDYISKKIEL